MNYKDISQSDFSLDYTTGFSGEIFDVVEPATGKVLGSINAATTE